MHSQSSGRERRWSHHGWNNRLSLFLIRAIVPRLPGPLLLVTLWVTTAICYTAMRREREASLANLRKIAGARGWRLRLRSFMLFYNFSRFMISRLELRELSTEELRKRVVNFDEARGALEGLLEGKQGAVVATAHLGNWEMGLRLLRLSGRVVHVVMAPDGSEHIESAYDQLRECAGVSVHRMGEGRFAAVDLLSALRRGELVALQADRWTGDSHIAVPLFGEPIRLPLGPASLARAAGVPILPCFVLMERGKNLRVCLGQPIRVERGADPDAGLRAATRKLGLAIEAAVSQRPEQWFNFYPVWERDACPA